MQDVSGESSPPSPKRQRVRLACVRCRNRKTRCDGRQPVCEACESSGVGESCTYEPSQRQSQDYRRASNSFQNAHARPRKRARTLPALNSSKSAGFEDTDGLATVPGYSSTDDLYGPSSNVAFSRAVVPNPNGRGPERGSHAFPRGFGSKMPRRSNLISLLPKRRTADELLRCFWDFMHPVFPILHKTTFLAQYTMLWSGDEPGGGAETVYDAEDAVFESMLNLVFAIGSKFSPSIPLAERDEVASGFYQTFRRSYSNDFLDYPSLPIVQMLLLEGVYLQSSQYASRCWSVVGLAIRVAQSLGLHADSGKDHVSSQLQREVRRRVWHNCVSLDRLLSMTSGRPHMITGPVSVPLPLAIDDEYLSSAGIGQQPQHIVSYLSLFTSSCRLFDILIDVLQLLSYDDLPTSQPAQSDAAERLENITIQTLKFSRRLEDFLATTPPEMNLQDSPPRPIQDQYSILNLQQQVLYCRFLYVKMLSLRPLLMHAINTERLTGEQIILEAKSSILGREFIRQCCQQCIETAQQLVKTIYENLGTPYRSAGWHAVYFVFSSATCILAASQSSMMNMSLYKDSFNTFWDRCWAILRAHEAHITTARRAIKVLEAKKQRILSNQAAFIGEYELSDLNQQRSLIKLVVSNQDASLSAMNHSSMSNREDHSLDYIPETEFAETIGMHEELDINNIDITWLDQCLANLDWLEPSTS